MDHKRKIGLFPLARVMGVGRQQQRKTRGDTVKVQGHGWGAAYCTCGGGVVMIL